MQVDEKTTKYASIFKTTNIVKNFESEYMILTEKVPNHLNIVKIWSLFIDIASSENITDWIDSGCKC